MQRTVNPRLTDHVNVDLAKLHEDVVFGRSNGMIIWQPRIQCWWDDRKWDGRGMGCYEGMTKAEMYRSLGCSDRLYQYNSCFVARESSRMSRHAEKLDDCRTANIIKTPVGTITQITRSTESSRGVIVEKRWIETRDDMEVMTWVMDNTAWEWDRNCFESIRAEVGDLGAPTMYMPRVNVQHLYIDVMGVESAIYALYEWGGVVDDYFKALHENHVRLIDAINASPINVVDFGDNLHCATLSPRLYEEYVMPAYLDRCERLHKGDKFVASHWDGDVKSLLRFARTSGLDGIEAITPFPQGDVTIEEVKEALGDDIFLLDGIPAVFFDETFPVDTLEACTHRLIELFAPKLVLGISDEMSSHGDIERIRIVGEIVDNYNASLLPSHVS